MVRSTGSDWAEGTNGKVTECFRVPIDQALVSGSGNKIWEGGTVPRIGPRWTMELDPEAAVEG